MSSNNSATARLSKAGAESDLNSSKQDTPEMRQGPFEELKSEQTMGQRSEQSQTNDYSTHVINLRGKQYLLYEGKLLEDEEASLIFSYYRNLLYEKTGFIVDGNPNELFVGA